MAKYIKLLSILVLIYSSGCKKYEKRYVVDPKEVSEHLKLESKLIEYDKDKNFGAYTSYKINSLQNFYIKTPKPFKKDFKNRYTSEKLLGTIKNNIYNPATVIVGAMVMPFTLIGDTISFALTQDGSNIDPHTSKSTFFEPNKSKYSYCSEIKFNNEENINIKLLSKLKLLDKKFNDNQKLIHVIPNQKKIYKNFNSSITSDYKKLNQIGIKLKSKTITINLNKENIKILNDTIIKTYLDLKNLCNKDFKTNLQKLFTTKENHLILKYGFNKNNLTKHKLNSKHNIFIIDPKVANNKKNITYQLYYLNEDNLRNNLHYILNKMDNLKSVKLKLSKKNKKDFNRNPIIKINNDYYDSTFKLLKEEFKDNKIYQAIYNLISKKIGTKGLYYNNNKPYIALPKTKRQLTIKITHSDFYDFEKTINLKKNQRTIAINDIIEKSDYKYLINRLKKKVSKKPSILVGDADSEVLINNRYVISRYCDSYGAEIDKKYYSNLTYHKEPKVRKDLSYELDKLMNAGYRYKNSFKIYCDIKAEDHYPFKGLVTINNATYYKQKNIIFYLPHILSKSKKKPYYFVR